jgi:CPA1 family monovalent cation:H+ antiporter
VVACVTAAILLGNLGRRRTMSAVTRVTLTTVWDYAAFVANSLIFLLIGLSVKLEVILSHVGTVLIAFAVVLVARAVTVYGFGLIARVFHAGPPLSWQHVLVWGGLRGTIALALVLSVPAALAGREDLVTVTFGVVLLSLLAQGLTLALLTRRLGLAGASDKADEREREVLLDGFVRAHEELDRLEDAGVVGRVRRRDLEQVLDAGESSVLEGLPPLADEPEDGQDEKLVERIGELVAQRRSLDALRHGGAVTDAAAAPLAADIDERIALLAARLGSAGPQAGAREA